MSNLQPTKAIIASPSYSLLAMAKNNYKEVNVAHRALADAFERLAFEYAIRIAKDDNYLVPDSIRVEIRKELFDIQVFIHIEEKEYKSE